jgi:hypothetical protein
MSLIDHNLNLIFMTRVSVLTRLLEFSPRAEHQLPCVTKREMFHVWMKPLRVAPDVSDQRDLIKDEIAHTTKVIIAMHWKMQLFFP